MKKLRSTKNRFYWVALAMFLATTSVTARALPVAAGVTAADEEVPVHPIDELQERLYKLHKSKKAKTLKKAFDLLQKEKFSEAYTLASPVQYDAVFSDYGFWIAGSASRGQADKANDAHNYSSAQSLAQRAISLFIQIENHNPYSPFLKSIPREVGKSELVMGDALWGSHRWLPAEQAFEKGFQRMAVAGALSQVLPENLQHYGESCSKKMGELCVSWIQRFSNAFVRNSEEIKALAAYFPSIADRAKVSHGAAKAQGYKAPDLDQVAFDAAMKQYFDEKYSQSIKSFRQFMDDYPRSAYRYRARYWLAQAFTHQQEHEKAQKMYEDLQKDSPLSYYGLLSSLASGKPVDSAIDSTLPSAAESDPSLQGSEIIHLKRAQNFVAEKAYGLAAIELRDLRPRDGLTSSFLVYLAMLDSLAADYNHAFIILGDLIQRGYEGVFSSYGLRMVFPVAYLELIKKYSIENQLDPVLVISLIKQESAFDQDALSGVGASGLMQLMPQTAVETIPDIKAADLIDAEENIRVGTRYLRKLMNKFNGNIVLSLAGYNAGPNAAERWLRDSPPKRGIQEFIEAIPYKETREYVASIIRNYYWYSRKLTGDTPRSLSYFWNTYGPPEVPPSVPAPQPASLDGK